MTEQGTRGPTAPHQQTYLGPRRTGKYILFFGIFFGGAARPLLDTLWTIRNLSDKVNESEIAVETAGLVEQCIKRLGSHDVNHIICAAGILSNLTCNSSANKRIFVKLGGVEAMVRTVQRVRYKLYPIIIF